MTTRLDSPSAAVRIRVMKRDRFQCSYCGAPGTDAELEVDHIIPVSRGGSHHMSNLTTACRGCNQEKSDGTMERRPTPKVAAYNGLIGFYLHTFKDGEIHYQGTVVGLDGDIALVQLFSFLTGYPTNVIPIPKKTIYDECKLYASSELMIQEYEKYEIRRRRDSGEVTP